MIVAHLGGILLKHDEFLSGMSRFEESYQKHGDGHESKVPIWKVVLQRLNIICSRLVYGKTV